MNGDRRHRDRRWPLALFAVALLAVSVRAGLAALVWGRLPHGFLLNADSAVYRELALGIAGLEGGAPLTDVFRLSPLATFWGALWHLVAGPSVYAVVVPQIALGGATAALVASAARKVARSAGAGVAAGVLVALCEPLVFYDIAILATSLSIFLFAVVVRLCLTACERPALAKSGALGLAAGLLIACRPNAVLFAPVALLLVAAATRALPARRRIAHAGALVLLAILPIVPIAAKNAVGSGAFVPTTASAGLNLFIGNNQGATGRLEPTFGARNAADLFTAFERNATRVAGRELDPAEVSSFWIEQTCKEIAEDPGRWLGLLARKIVYGVNDFEVPDSWDVQFLETRLPPAIAALPGFGALLALGALGLAITWRGGPPGARALHGAVAVAFVTMLVFFVAGRYRATALPALAIAAGAGISWLVERIRVARAREPERRGTAARILVAAAAVAAVATLAHLPVLDQVPGPNLERLAAAYQREGRPGEARAAWAAAVEAYRATGDDRGARRAALEYERLERVTLKKSLGKSAPPSN